MNITVVRQARRNPHAAAENRRMLDTLGVTCVNLLGAAGAGKTRLLESVVPRLGDEITIGVVTADPTLTCDAQQFAALGIPTVQILTESEAHLDAASLQAGLAELPLAELDLVIVENLGSQIAPPRQNLGEHLRIAVLSIPAGHRAVEKYTHLFQDAALILLTKYDLLPHVDFDLDGTVHRLRRINPSAEIICTDTRNRVGTDRLAGWLLGYLRAERTGLSRSAEALTTPSGAF